MTNADYYNKALEIVHARKLKAEMLSEMKKKELHDKLPELDTLEFKIKSTFSDALKMQLAGKAVDFDEASKKSLEFQNQRKMLLHDAGINESDLEPKYHCKKCNDSGYVDGKVCECVKFAAAKLIYDELNKDVPLEDCTFSSFNLKYYPETSNDGYSPREVMGKIFESCVSYADKFNPHMPSLLFYGNTGLGKTHLSLSIANEVISRGYNVVYGPISRILQQIEEEYFSRDLQSNQTLNTVNECDLLIIDDLGTEFTTPFVTSTIYDIINSRILSKKPTIINTNLSMEEIEKRYSPRIVSRISGNYTMFMFVGSDVRALK